jgi:hypothetical protein
MDQAAITLQHRIDWLDRKPPKKAKKPKPWKLKSAWYRPQTLAQLSRGPSTATGLTAIAWERIKEDYVLGVGGPESA